MRNKLLKWVGLIVLITILGLSAREIFHKNQGKSTSHGSVKDGSISNAWLLPYWGKNYAYFSPLSYFIVDNAYLNNTLHDAVLEAYETCEETCPGVFFRTMECANKQGGKMLIHRTHRNGLSIDFMTPLMKNNKPFRLLDMTGAFHYLLQFNDDGRWNGNEQIEIDYETMAKHILALDDACKNHGMRIKMVIFKVELKDEFYATSSGKKVKARGIYFARSLRPVVNAMHDEHYHIDFAFL